MIFESRKSAGEQLAKALARFGGRSDVTVAAIPHGGIVVGAEVARQLNAPLDVIVSKKIQLTENHQDSVGAVTSDGSIHVHEQSLQSLGVDVEDLASEIQELIHFVERTERQFEEVGAEGDLAERVVIVVDECVQTGHTLYAAVKRLHEKGAGYIVLASPVASEESVRILEPFTDEIEVLHMPVIFGSPGQFYEQYPDISDEEAREWFQSVRQEQAR